MDDRKLSPDEPHQPLLEAPTERPGSCVSGWQCLVLLDEQDRSRWNRMLITEGTGLVERALVSGRAGPYALQVAIAAVHAEAPSAAATDWAQIVGLK